MSLESIEGRGVWLARVYDRHLWSDHQAISCQFLMSIIGMNHAVLYVRDARAHERFYREVLGFEANIEDCDGKYVFMLSLIHI